MTDDLRPTHPAKAMAVYTGLRFGLFLVCLVVFYACGIGLLLSLALAAAVSGVAGYFLLSRQRLALSAAIEGKVAQVKATSAERTAREDAIADEIYAQQQRQAQPPA